MSKRLSFGQFDARRLYEFYLAHCQALGSIDCTCCQDVGKKIENFIGRDSADLLKKMVEENPYYKIPKEDDAKP